MPSAVGSHSHRPTTKVSHKGFKSKKATKGVNDKKLRRQFKATESKNKAAILANKDGQYKNQYMVPDGPE